MNFPAAVLKTTKDNDSDNADHADAAGDDDDADADADINLPACRLLATKVLRNQLQSCIQVPFSSHLGKHNSFCH